MYEECGDRYRENRKDFGKNLIIPKDLNGNHSLITTRSYFFLYEIVDLSKSQYCMSIQPMNYRQKVI